MHPFFDVAIFPVLEAAQATRVVEIGAFRGETTALLLDRLGPTSELHVIDPVPVFDPSEHTEQFPGRYLFYRELSHHALPKLPPVDAALIDGDHNWYTVFHELRLLSETARAADRPLPILVLHDVGWPYGRRDLYYDPDTIPEEFRQPHRQAGMLRGQPELLKRGGMNPTMHNAVMEGGPRNGVMTALDDFLASIDRPVRRLVLPVYYGLAIVVDQQTLAEHPEVGAVLDRLESEAGLRELIELAENVRLQNITTEHGVFFNAERRHDRLAHRYLDVIKAALMNEHYLEHEVRIDHLLKVIESSSPVFGEAIRDPVRQLKVQTGALREVRRAGKLGDPEDGTPSYFPYTTMGRHRLDHLERCLTTIHDEAVHGDLVDVSPGRGGGGIFMRAFVEAYELTEPVVWMAGRFSAAPTGSPAPTVDDQAPAGLPGGGRGFPDLRPDLNVVRDAFERFDLYDRVRFLHGDYDATLPPAPIEKIALLRLGDDLGAEAGVVLDALYDRLTLGGFVLVDDAVDPATLAAVEAFRARRGIEDPIEQVDWASIGWRVLGPPAPTHDESQPTAAVGRANAPLVAPAHGGRCDLSIVVVFYNMKREAARTLHTLSRAYQRDIDDLRYEVIAVENGSDPDQRLGADFVQRFGPEFQYVDFGDQATPSPIDALNHGIARSNGAALALMIDGAHVVTPGVLHYGLLGLRTYAPAMVATQQWHLGPSQQGEAMNDGYDQSFEDKMLDSIDWPTDGYRLFDIGNFLGDRDWLDGMWESNCLFVDRDVLVRVGGFDESFAMAGGGFANLDIYERLGADPGVTVATILGEGSFHQVHGGTTTNVADFDERHRRLASYADHYVELRGRGFRGHGKKIHYIGTMVPEVARTRARRRRLPNPFIDAADDPDGRPRESVPIPQDLRFELIDAYWRSLRWRETTWLGHRVPKVPTDLFAYQEIIARRRPKWIVETGTGTGGRALFLASICDLVDRGQVISIDPRPAANRPEHDRITYLDGAADDPEIVARVHEMVGPDPKAFVILGSLRSASKMLKEFDLYSPLVPVGSYVVVEDTIVNGHPVWPSFGRGPGEAVRLIAEARGDFVSDLTLERHYLTFNPKGFLKRLSRR